MIARFLFRETEEGKRDTIQAFQFGDSGREVQMVAVPIITKNPFSLCAEAYPAKWQDWRQPWEVLRSPRPTDSLQSPKGAQHGHGAEVSQKDAG